MFAFQQRELSSGLGSARPLYCKRRNKTDRIWKIGPQREQVLLHVEFFCTLLCKPKMPSVWERDEQESSTVITSQPRTYSKST